MGIEIPINLSSADITDVCRLLKDFLKQISLVRLSREDIDAIDMDNTIGGHRSHPNIVKVINRWGIRDDSGGNYYRLLNDVIGKLSSRNLMLRIYEPIQLFLFNKLIERWTNTNTIFSREEIEVFFLQPYEMIINTDIFISGLALLNLIIEEVQKLKDMLKSDDSKEFLNEGVSRRLFMLKYNIDNISTIYNDQRTKAIDEEEKATLELNVNFFYANVCAILDCAAFVLAFEDPNYKIDRHNNKYLKKVGLFNKDFYEKFDQLEDKLDLKKLKPWYDEIIDLRHPVAHRIPLYFPDFYTEEENRKIQEATNKYFAESVPTDDDLKEPATLEEKTAKLNKLKEKREQAEQEWKKVRLENTPFAGCFLHSYQESKKYYHLSRLSLDLGILYHLLKETFKYLSCTELHT
jgi:hypothetical protein